LAIESATDVASAALLRNGELLELRSAPSELPASETLLPTVLDLLAAHGVPVAAIDAVAVSIGPGSFTGLRVGTATAKGLAFGTAIRSLAVPTLAALAAKGAALQPTGRVVAALDARRGEVYTAGYEGEDSLAPPVWGPAVMTPAELMPRLVAHEGPLRIIGDGVAILEPPLRGLLGGRADWISGPDGTPDAEWVGRLGFRMLTTGAGLAIAELAPWYLRRAEAEVRRTGHRLEPG
jgi:tRNA threonylcarbamoyladenosine biosynthesis protein TsaB